MNLCSIDDKSFRTWSQWFPFKTQRVWGRYKGIDAASQRVDLYFCLVSKVAKKIKYHTLRTKCGKNHNQKKDILSHALFFFLPIDSQVTFSVFLLVFIHQNYALVHRNDDMCLTYAHLIFQVKNKSMTTLGLEVFNYRNTRWQYCCILALRWTRKTSFLF